MTTGYICLSAANHRGRINAFPGMKPPPGFLCSMQHRDPFCVMRRAGACLAAEFEWTPGPGGGFLLPNASDVAHALALFFKVVSDSFGELVETVADDRRLLAQEHLCHRGTVRPVKTHCGCCAYCTENENQRRAALDEIKRAIPDFVNDRAFGGDQQMLCIAPRGPDKPNIAYEAELLSITETDAVPWPSLRIDIMTASWAPLDDSGFGMFVAMCEADKLPGVRPGVPFALTDELIVAAHNAKKVVSTGWDLASRLSGPSLDDMLARRVKLEDLVETMFFCTSHVIDGLYGAYARADVARGLYRVAVFADCDKSRPREVLHDWDV